MGRRLHRRKIPNNVDLGRRPARCSARSSSGSRTSSTGGTTWARKASRSSTSTCAPRSRVDPKGWAQVRLREDARLPLGHLPRARRGGPQGRLRRRTWASRRGRRCRASTAPCLRRLIVTQGDTEPASVEQQRHLGKTAPSLYDLRNLFQVNVEEGRHLWAMVYLLHTYFGRDGREEAEALLRAPLGRRRQAAHPRRVQRADARLAVVLHVHVSSPTATASSSSRRSPSRASIRWRAPAASC